MSLHVGFLHPGAHGSFKIIFDPEEGA